MTDSARREQEKGLGLARIFLGIYLNNINIYIHMNGNKHLT